MRPEALAQLGAGAPGAHPAEAPLDKGAGLAGNADVAHPAQRRAAAQHLEGRAAVFGIAPEARLDQRPGLPFAGVDRVPTEPFRDREEQAVLVVDPQVRNDAQRRIARALPGRAEQGADADRHGPALRHRRPGRARAHPGCAGRSGGSRRDRLRQRGRGRQGQGNKDDGTGTHRRPPQELRSRAMPEVLHSQHVPDVSKHG